MDTMPKKRGDRFLLYAGHIIAWVSCSHFPWPFAGKAALASLWGGT